MLYVQETKKGTILFRVCAGLRSYEAVFLNVIARILGVKFHVEHTSAALFPRMCLGPEFHPGVSLLAYLIGRRFSAPGWSFLHPAVP